METSYWKLAFDYFTSLGVPEPELRLISIPPEDADQIVSLVWNRKPRSILEIGTFVGLSTSVLVQASSLSTQLVCVDPDLPVTRRPTEVFCAEGDTAFTFVRQAMEHFGATERVTLLRGFFSGMSHGKQLELERLGIDPRNIGIVMTQALDLGPYDMVFVDGDHFAESVYADLLALHGHLAVNGLVVLHDLSGNWRAEVQTGVAKFLTEYPTYRFEVQGNLGLLDMPSL